MLYCYHLELLLWNKYHHQLYLYSFSFSLISLSFTYQFFFCHCFRYFLFEYHCFFWKTSFLSTNTTCYCFYIGEEETMYPVTKTLSEMPDFTWVGSLCFGTKSIKFGGSLCREMNHCVDWLMLEHFYVSLQYPDNWWSYLPFHILFFNFFSLYVFLPLLFFLFQLPFGRHFCEMVYHQKNHSNDTWYIFTKEYLYIFLFLYSKIESIVLSYGVCCFYHDQLDRFVHHQSIFFLFCEGLI